MRCLACTLATTHAPLNKAQKKIMTKSASYISSAALSATVLPGCHCLRHSTSVSPIAVFAGILTRITFLVHNLPSSSGGRQTMLCTWSGVINVRIDMFNVRIDRQ